MNPLCNSLKSLYLQPSPIHSKPDLFFSHSLSPTFTTPFKTKYPPRKCHLTVKSNANAVEIDLVRNKQGVYAPKQEKVVILWDLDNKPPRGPPYEAALALKKMAENFGEVVDMSAYANRHAFIHLPPWVLQERRERKSLDILERKGIVTPSELYICGVCGRKCKTNLDLKKHFKQLHERERQKKLNRMKSLKGKKRQRFKERYISGNHKYNEAARSLVTPKVGYGLARELRRAGVYVKTVEDKPQAADWALKRQMQHSMSRGIDWLFLVSDDKDFVDMLKRAKEANLGTVVVGDWNRALGRHADLWVSWIGVENGEVTEKDLVPKRRRKRSEDDGLFSVSEFDGGSVGELDGVVNDLVVERTEFGGVRISLFSEGEEDEDEWEIEGVGDVNYFLDDSEDEVFFEEDGYY
ncbi:uncharacterized protein LOC111318786 [Durio zibethinus]|uniref:Uncharacterized protein LOC111318786 n=1 Tax=Durio zibethinus TaxID=66656 RepID=A0A6P5WEC4_DURZI|nr:uncharacterized protein LOC111318786 [Durio zibethinus]